MNKLFSGLFLLSAGSLCLAQAVDAPDSGATIAPPDPALVITVCLSGTNEIPANTSLCLGSGTFTLNGNILDYDVGLPFPNLAPTAGGIYGPAGAGTNGDVIFAWTNYVIQPGSPSSGFKGAWQYQGSYTLSAEQVDQFKAGLWYVNIYSADFPDGELRGQIALPSADATANGASPAPAATPLITASPNSTPAQDPSRVLPGPGSGPKKVKEPGLGPRPKVLGPQGLD